MSEAGAIRARWGGFYTEQASGRIHHRAEPLMFVLALLVVPAIVLEQGAPP